MKRRATGYDFTEVTEEYGENKDGELKVLKKKVVTKNLPPDVSALKLLIDIEGEENDVLKMTTEELIAEKEKILKRIGGEKGEGNKT